MRNLKIGLVTSRFNEEVTTLLEEGALGVLEESRAEILLARVPGAVEIPLAVRALFEQGCDGVVACGAVIRGETTHYELVCNSVERGVTQLMLDIGKPIGFGVITVENDEQAMDRCGGKHGNKGAEAAQVCLEMIGLLGEIKGSSAALKEARKNAGRVQSQSVSPQKKKAAKIKKAKK